MLFSFSLLFNLVEILYVFHHSNFIFSKFVDLIYDSLVIFEPIPPLELLVAKHVPWVNVAFGNSDVLVLLGILIKL